MFGARSRYSFEAPRCGSCWSSRRVVTVVTTLTLPLPCRACSWIGDASKSFNIYELPHFGVILPSTIVVSCCFFFFEMAICCNAILPYFGGHTSSVTMPWPSMAILGGSTIEVMGRWRRRHLAVGRDFVEESFTLADGRTLFYKQPEAGCRWNIYLYTSYYNILYMYI